MSRTYEGFRLEGGRQLRKALKEAGDDLSDLKAAHKRAADIVAAASKGRVPTRTGRLQATIRPAGSNTAATIRAGTKRIPYAACVHWGRMVWPSREVTPKPPRTQHAAFVYPRLYISAAAQKTEPQWIVDYLKTVDEITQRVEQEAHP